MKSRLTPSAYSSIENCHHMRTLMKSTLGNLGLQICRLDRLGVDPFADLYRFIPEPSVVFDVGANRGQTAIHLRRRFPEAIIHSFEPCATTFQDLVSAVIRDERVRAWNMGLGSERGTKPLYRDADNPELNSLLRPGPDLWANMREGRLVE